jgi:hypothetical protein
LGFYPSEVCSLPEPAAFRQALPLISLATVGWSRVSARFHCSIQVAPNSRCPLTRVVAASPWAVAQCRVDPCGNTRLWQLRGLLAWPASYRSKDQQDVGGVACADSANACAHWNPDRAFARWNTGIGAQDARVVSGRHSTACRDSHLSWVSRPSGFDDVDRALDFASRSPLALGRTARAVPEPQGINGSSSRQGVHNNPTTLRKSNAATATCLALMGFLPSCIHQSLWPSSVRAYSFRLGVRSALPPRHPPFLKRSFGPTVTFL